MVSKILFGALILTTLAAYGTPARSQNPREAVDHYDPVVLNELAVASVRKGDHSSAWILLERAGLLAPHDKRIARNLALLRAYREGRGPAGESPAPPQMAQIRSDTGGEVGDLLREPPPIWTANQR